jgi:hypothetical protein
MVLPGFAEQDEMEGRQENLNRATQLPSIDVFVALHSAGPKLDNLHTTTFYQIMPSF